MERKQNNFKGRVIASALALVATVGGATLPAISSQLSVSNAISASADYSTRYGTLSFIVNGDGTIKITSCGLKNATIDSWHIDQIIAPTPDYHGSITYTVTSLGYQAFKDTMYMKSISFGSNVKVLECESVANCPNLSSVGFDNISCGLEKIDAYAFKGCPKLNHIALPDTVNSIGSQAFGYDANGNKYDSFRFICRQGTSAETTAKNYVNGKAGFTVDVVNGLGQTVYTYDSNGNYTYHM